MNSHVIGTEIEVFHLQESMFETTGQTIGTPQVDHVQVINTIVSWTSILAIYFDFFKFCILFNFIEYFGFKVGFVYFYVLQM